MYKIKARVDITADPPILANMKQCDLCGACVGICPPNCITMTDRLISVETDDCIKCGFCIPTCPVGALSWNEFPAVRSNGNGRESN